MFKLWGVGDITQEELNNQKFTHLEAPAGDDVNNHITLQRVLRNLYEIQEDTHEILRDILNTSARGEGVLKDGDFNPELISLSGVNYIRIKPGIAFTGDKIFVNRPLVHNASKQLEALLKLRTSAIESQKEYVEITYNGKFFATIKENGTAHPYDNGGAGYNTGIALLEAIKADFPTVLNIDLTKIQLEPMFSVGSGGYLGISVDGELYYTATSGNFDLYQVSSAGTITTDHRTYYHKYNQFENGIELNKKDTSTNEDVSITIHKATDGNAIIKWDDTNKQFDLNKSLKINGTINGLSITETTGKMLDLSNASLTIGGAGKTGAITVTSNNTTDKTITIKENTTLTGGTMLSRESTKSYQYSVKITTPSTQIAVPAEFNIETDTLVVFENLVYFLQPGVDYNLNTSGTLIEKASGYVGSNFPTGTYIFLILKNIPMGDIQSD